MSANAQRSEEAMLRICNRSFEARPPSLPERGESLANVKQYIAFLYLTRASGPEAWKKAGQKLAECIRLHPRTLLTRKTWHLLFAWSLLQLLPVRRRRPAVITLLRIYGRWSMLRRPEVGRLVEDLERSGLGRAASRVGDLLRGGAKKSPASAILVQADVIVVGIFLKPQDVAIYSVAAATSRLVTFPLDAATALSAPKFAALHAQQRHLDLQALVTDVTRWTFWPSLAIAVIFVAFGSMVLRLFGPGFEQGYATLLILTLGQLANAFAGPVASLLNMTGHQVVTARVLSASAIFCVAFGLAFTRIWGSVGTAIVFSGAMVLWNAWLAMFVVRKLEIYPSLSRR